MGRSSERMQDSPPSAWPVDSGEAAPAAPGWLASLAGWPRRAAPSGTTALSHGSTPASAAHGPASAHGTPPSAEPSRGQALRQAHRALRDRLRAQRDLRRVLPHLHFIERSLARQGSAALQELPLRVLQRGLQQLARLPADSLAERAHFSVLQHRLAEAIQAWGTAPPQAPRRTAAPVDSFLGGLDSRPAPLTGGSGLDVSEVPQSVYDDLLQADRIDGGPSDGDKADGNGGRRRS